MSSRFDELRIFPGNGNPVLARAIADRLSVPIGDMIVTIFTNENIFVKINESVREKDVFVVQSLASPLSDRIMELLIMLDACKRASAGRVTAVIPYFAYGRTDKKDQPRVPITARLLADMIQVAGAQQVITLDLHAGQIQGFFNIPVDELTAVYLLSRYIKRKGLEKPVVVSTDIGNAKRARNFAELIGAPLAIVEKRRVGNAGRSEALNVIGSVDGLQAILVDDEIDTAGTMIQAVQAVQAHGASEVYAACVHPILSGSAIERLRDAPIREIVCTDSVPIPPAKWLDKFRVLSVAPLLGEAIQRIHTGASVGSMFKEDRRRV
jgi:ribose-phosphate pyrophosphokinase